MEHLVHSFPSPPPQINYAKMARFCSFVPSSLLLEAWKVIVPFYSVQGCVKATLISDLVSALSETTTT